MKRIFFVLCLLSYPAICSSTTAPDLKNRIQIDGVVSEFDSDEWILDATTVFRERPDDSRWGADNEISRIAVTWDHDYFYVAVTCATYGGVLMVFIEHTAGGVNNLEAAATLRRSVVFTGLSPNLIINAEGVAPDAGVAIVSSTEPFRSLDTGLYVSRLFQSPGGSGGALEIALPWEVVRPEGRYLKILAIVTRGEGSGAGDAAPDPSSVLGNRAYLDNAITIPVDSNLDGVPDFDVSPRDAASFGFTQRAPEPEGRSFDIRLSTKVLVPDRAQLLEFRVEPGDLTGDVQFYLTGEVFSIDGKRVAVLFKDELRTFQRGVKPPVDQWDGRNAGGDIVPGGIYVINVSGGASRGATTHVARKPVTVAR